MGVLSDNYFVIFDYAAVRVGRDFVLAGVRCAEISYTLGCVPRASDFYPNAYCGVVFDFVVVFVYCEHFIFGTPNSYRSCCKYKGAR